MVLSQDIGIDLGTANTLVYSKNKGIIINEPSVAAIDIHTKQLLAIGSEAKKMIGKTPANISVIRPLKNGVIADFEITTEMLKSIMKKVNKALGITLRKPNVVICAPSGATTVEKRAIEDAIRSCGAKTVHLIEEPIAAAIGADLAVDEPVANMIVDIGGGTTEAAIISYGGVVCSNSIRTGGDKMDEDIIQYVRKEYSLLIGEPTAEMLKKEIGYAPIEHDVQEMEIRGRDLVTGLPKTITISSIEIQKAIKETVLQILETVRATLENSPPELSGDIVDRGIILSGGASLLNGLKDWLASEMIVPVNLAPNPLESVAIGTGRSLHVISQLKKAQK